VHSASVITGVGASPAAMRRSSPTMHQSSGGTFTETVKKASSRPGHPRQNICLRRYMVDSGGALPAAAGTRFPDERHFGRIYKQATDVGAGIPQIAIRDGAPARRGAPMFGESDESIIVRKPGQIFSADRRW